MLYIAVLSPSVNEEGLICFRFELPKSFDKEKWLKEEHTILLIDPDDSDEIRCLASDLDFLDRRPDTLVIVCIKGTDFETRSIVEYLRIELDNKLEDVKVYSRKRGRRVTEKTLQVIFPGEGTIKLLTYLPQHSLN